MASSRTSKEKISVKNTGISRHAPADTRIPARLGGGVLKELVEQEMPSGELRHYSLAYINPLIFAGDNGRVLGYDNAHGFPHRHFMGTITPEPSLPWDEIREKFEREWREIALKFVKGE
ncbi:hypothetical protein SAMN05216319_3409 [Duganella sp. CF402]|uniref:hypothetical protein n=1 Tax=unclassified Duganella TaxID=2636909 RepID=UPI0008B2F86F|nr:MULTISPECIES: hypothetical protein [unclassified Duganella]SEM02920.1 hypothetical protein SAMN05216319_3409 [Duganella sp. CF402]